jgi:hypothetical protein
MQQHPHLKLKPFKIRHCTTCFGLLGHHQVLKGITLTSFRNINMKTPIVVARKAEQFPPNFNTRNDGRVGRNM